LVNPANPLNLGANPNYTKPVRNSIGLGAVGLLQAEPPDSFLRRFLDNWTLTLSASYDFLNDRSRVGGLSVDSDSALIDLTGNYKRSPWTWFDLSYIYSHAHGTAPGGASQTGYQNAGGLRILQPFPLGSNWKPAVFTSECFTDNFIRAAVNLSKYLLRHVFLPVSVRRPLRYGMG